MEGVNGGCENKDRGNIWMRGYEWNVLKGEIGGKVVIINI